MNIRGTIKGIARDYHSGRYTLSVEMTEGDITTIEKYLDKDMSIDLKQWRARRSKSANALLWACLGEIAEAPGGDKWDYYLQALRKYGQYTMIEVREDAVEKFRTYYRECDVVGQKGDMVHLLCYYGSSCYDKREFSVLLNGVIDDMKQAGLPTPTSEEMRRALERLEQEDRE